jgi:hypothetical protein
MRADQEFRKRKLSLGLRPGKSYFEVQHHFPLDRNPDFDANYPN